MVLHYKNIIINTCQLHTYRYFPRWRLLQHEFRTQYSARLNSNGPSPLHGQIQMSAAWGKICGQIPQRGDSRSVQMPHICPYPPPLRLNIDTCITSEDRDENCVFNGCEEHFPSKEKCQSLSPIFIYLPFS